VFGSSSRIGAGLLAGPDVEAVGDAKEEGGVATYSRTFADELLPGTIEPLMWSAKASLVGGAWSRFLEGIVGTERPRSKAMVKQFHYRAYLDMTSLGSMLERSGLPKDSLDRLLCDGDGSEKCLGTAQGMDILLSLPSSVDFLLHFSVHSDGSRLFLQRLDEDLRRHAGEDLSRLTDIELLLRVDDLTKSLEESSLLRVCTFFAARLFGNMLQARLREVGLEADSDLAMQEFEGLHLGSKRRLLLATHRRAERMSLLKQMAIDLSALGDVVYAHYFQELGRRLEANELLASPDDVFFLRLDEVRQVVAGGCAGNTCNNYRVRAAMRRREMIEAEGSTPPEVIRGDRPPV